jgi:hypothetical protein
MGGLASLPLGSDDLVPRMCLSYGQLFVPYMLCYYLSIC